MKNRSRDPSNFIKDIKFELHPTFNPPSVTRKYAPFSIQRIGWGVFNIGITIKWQPWLKIGRTRLNHMLSFQ